MPLLSSCKSSDDHLAPAAILSPNWSGMKNFPLLHIIRCNNANFYCLSLILLILCIPVISSRESLAQPQSHQQHHHHRILSRKYHEETSFALLESGAQVVDVRQELQETISDVNQLRFVEEQASPKNVTAQVGHHVYLHCIVDSLGDKMVSWLRLRDFNLLTVGLYTYTADDRFVVRQGSLQTNDWALQIKHVTPVDEGIYECQVNSDPPRSQYYRLHVKVPQTRMVGSPDMFVRAGSPLNLTCVISNSPELPAFVFWYHNERMINYDYESKEKGSISMRKDPAVVDTVISHLLIRSTKLNDSGNFSCHFVGSSVEPAHIYVHVLQGERRQSDQVQNDENNRSAGSAGGAPQPIASKNHILSSAAIVFALILFYDT